MSQSESDQQQPVAPPPLPPQPASDPPPLPLHVQPLGYAGPGAFGQQPGSRAVLARRMAVGCLGYVVISALWFAVGGSAYAGARPYLFEGWVALTVGLLGLSLFLRLKYGYAGFGYGILAALSIGALLIVGLILLVIALCSGQKW